MLVFNLCILLLLFIISIIAIVTINTFFFLTAVSVLEPSSATHRAELGSICTYKLQFKLFQFRAELFCSLKLAQIVSSHSHHEDIRGLSTHTSPHLFKVIQPYLLCHDPRQHITNPTVAFSSSCKAFGMKREIIHTPFYGKKCDGSQCLGAGADR